MSLSPTNNCCDRPAGSGGGESPASDIPAAKTRILFVDDEPSMLRVLKMGMRTMNGVWNMDFVNGGEEALTLVDQKNFDVIVTDMRMPGVNGAQLLNHVLRVSPRTVRIILWATPS